MPGSISSSDTRHLLQEYLQAARPARPSPILPSGLKAPAPLSFGQEQMWLHLKIAPSHAASAYNEAITIHRKGPLDAKVLAACLSEVIRRHEAWRTTFSEVDARPAQIVHSPQPVALPVVDLRELPEAEREARALRILSEEARRPYDPGAGPLVRPTLVRMADAEYRLMLAMHHIVFDGFSIYRVLLPELATLYKAFSNGAPSPLPELPIQYSDFAHWQRSLPESPAGSRALQYWRKKLSGDLPVLQLPSDRTRPAVQTFRGATYKFGLPSELSRELREFSRREGVTLFMSLLAAFDVFLHHYTGQDDILIGGVTAGRNRAELEPLIGFFLNTVVLRTDLSGYPTFRELLARVKETTLEALTHDDVPFELLVKELRPHRDISVNPFFQVLFSIEPPLAFQNSDWGLSQGEVDLGATKFDLDFQLDETRDGIIGHCSYSTDLFDSATVERMVQHWQQVLENAVLDPNRRISQLSLLPPREKQRLLLEWNQTDEQYPRDRCIHELFEEQVRRAPDDVVVVYRDEEFTYRELNRRANLLAHRLHGLGVKADTPVGLFLDRSVETIVGLLGILKAGGAYLILDPQSPPERLSFIVNDANLKVVLTEQRLLDRWTAPSVTFLCLDDSLASHAGEQDGPLESEVACTNLAYVVYTSGSTGYPKGIEVTHRSVVRLIFATASLGQSRNEVFLQLAPLTFDASTYEIWAPLLRGGRCILFPENTLTASGLGEVIRKNAITTLWLTASLFHTLIDEAPEVLSTIRTLLIGGEPVSVSHVRRALMLLPATKMINGYGPTEGTTFTCLYRIPSQLDPGVSSIPIGRPIANTRVYVLDPHLNPCPVGVPGELCIAGDGLARGYLNRPELTAKQFLPDPFSHDPDARIYKTGDLARYQADGNVEFLGRQDQQVKVRGFRIELAEIEAVLLEHPVIQAAVVVAQEYHGSKRLVAHFVPKPGSSYTKPELLAFLRRRLPEYMLPAQLVCADRFPTLANGKIDRNSLNSIADDNEPEIRFHKVPKDVTEARLLEIWESVLPNRPIDLQRSFFELGGHSLLALSLVHRIETAFGRKMGLATFVNASSIQEIAAVLRDPGYSEQLEYSSVPSQ
jgi:amino acid adenylation domain-containing protein